MNVMSKGVMLKVAFEFLEYSNLEGVEETCDEVSPIYWLIEVSIEWVSLELLAETLLETPSIDDISAAAPEVNERKIKAERLGGKRK